MGRGTVSRRRSNLSVRVGLGIFSSEYSVVIETSNQKLVSLFMPRNLVLNVQGTPSKEINGTTGIITVGLVYEGQGADAVVELPGRSFEGPRTISVPKAALA
jgi:hypothetical protein